MLADGNGDYAKALGLEFNASGYGMGTRGQRFAIIVKDGVAKQVNVEAPGEFKVSAADYRLEAALVAAALLALRTSPPEFTEAQVERIARDTYGLRVTVRSLPGERDRNFHLHTADRRDFVLKILDFNSSPETTDCQLRVLEHLAEQDRCAAGAPPLSRPFWAGRSAPWPDARGAMRHA